MFCCSSVCPSGDGEREVSERITVSREGVFVCGLNLAVSEQFQIPWISAKDSDYSFLDGIITLLLRCGDSFWRRFNKDSRKEC